MYLEIETLTYLHWEFVRQLRNNPLVKDGFVNQDYIDIEDHEKYMKTYSDKFRLIFDNGEPVAYFRIIEDDISYCVSPDHQGRGVGKFIIRYIKDNFPTAVGRVKKDNLASNIVFKQCGYEKVDLGEFNYYIT